MTGGRWIRRLGRPGSAVLAGLVLLPVLAAAADPVDTQVIRGRYITLTTSTPVAPTLRPGVPTWWQVGIQAQPPSPGLVDLTLHLDGPLISGGRVELGLATCSVPWARNECPGVLVHPAEDVAAPSLSAGSVGLGSMPSSQQWWVRVRLMVPDRVPLHPGDSVSMVLSASGYGESVQAGGAGMQPELPRTGVDVRGIASWGLILASGGLLVLWRAERRRRRTSASPRVVVP